MQLPQESEVVHWIDTPTPIGELVIAGVFMTNENWGLKEMRSLEFYSMALILEGGGIYRDETGVEMSVQAGDCIIVEPGLQHQYGCEAGGTWKEVYFCFKGSAFDDWRRSDRFRDRRIFNLDNVDFWSPRWFRIVKSRPRNFFEVVATLTDVHLLINQVVAGEQVDWSFEERLEASKQHLQSWPPNTTIDWDLIAGECGCSYETWRKAFSKQYDISPARFRRNALMRQAGRLMTRSNLSNEELADQFGCSDGFHFSKLFKSVMGLSPQEFRKQLTSDHTKSVDVHD
ncbi:helix-turn-helix domain-containing protein [Coraliomargarita akajimensis]|uniref:Transcriptional regulator, AraC family n=1 Tax=Coraliomargarita akajimensis (strain DSM 45221 / IAM 15411 / JCM 23193 / KCTC 12865 / 04OKA010-24) TaxID=583355 RepID=D5EMI5_CORAD|nr:AraC family transcriptional regulator [Coraliomargarita akajimensis]ADE53391.1 transcriptional regulator, AraC family [Coraliomargarita akajimensis DSM 45221]